MFKQLIAVTACMVATTEAMTLKSDPICNSAGCTQYLHPEEKKIKKDYFVPDFGVDKEILQNTNSLNIAEKQLSHTWDFPNGEFKNKKVVKYKMDVPLEDDIKTS